MGGMPQDGLIPTGVEFGDEEALCRNFLLDVRRSYKDKLHVTGQIDITALSGLEQGTKNS
jgi:hypothetical protein